MSTLTLTDIQKLLRDAELGLFMEAREADKEKLAKVREALRQAHAEYRKLAAAYKAGQATVGLIQAKVDDLSFLVGESNSRRPAVADLLPDDPEVVEWRRTHDALVTKRAEAIARREAAKAKAPAPGLAAAYEGELGIVARLEQAERNLIRKLNGEDLGWQGGAFRV